MQDTPAHIEALQLHIFQSKPREERWRIGLQLIDDCLQMQREAVARAHPELTERQVVLHCILKNYGPELNERQTAAITALFEGAGK